MEWINGTAYFVQSTSNFFYALVKGFAYKNALQNGGEKSHV